MTQLLPSQEYCVVKGTATRKEFSDNTNKKNIKTKTNEGY
jgi:hypothetical protein